LEVNFQFIGESNTMELKAITIIQKEYTEYDDFFLSCEAFIGPENETYVYRVYDFNVISIKRLYNQFSDYGIMLNIGWMIMKFYDEDEIKQKVTELVRKFSSENDDEFYLKLSRYLRLQEE